MISGEQTFAISACACAVILLIHSVRGHMARALPAFVLLSIAPPYWLGLSYGQKTIPVALIGAAFLAALTYRGLGTIAVPDRLLAALIGAMMGAALVGSSRTDHMLAAVPPALASYLVGRQLGRQRSSRDYIAHTMTIVGVLAATFGLVEFFLDLHPFVAFHAQENSGPIWAPIQYRAGWPRSELSLGHSIVYGNLIAICIPFAVFVRRSTGMRVCSVLLMLAGVSVSFSRNALIAACVALVLSLLAFGRGRGISLGRYTALAGFGICLAFAAPLYLDRIGSQGELANSSQYRLGYLTVLPDVRLWGLAEKIYVEDFGGRFAWVAAGYPGGKIVTLDNTVLLWALQFGWAPAALFCLFLLWVSVNALSRRSGPALIATAGQTVTILTVAPVAQYPYIYWLTAGLAVGAWLTTTSYRSAVSHELADPHQLGAVLRTGP